MRSCQLVVIPECAFKHLWCLHWAAENSGAPPESAETQACLYLGGVRIYVSIQTCFEDEIQSPTRRCRGAQRFVDPGATVNPARSGRLTSIAPQPPSFSSADVDTIHTSDHGRQSYGKCNSLLALLRLKASTCLLLIAMLNIERGIHAGGAGPCPHWRASAHSRTSSSSTFVLLCQINNNQ